MSLNDKENISFDSRANEMLRGLNNQYKSDKFAKKYGKNAEYERIDDGSIQIDISTLSDEEFKELFDSYIVSSKMSVNNMTDDSYMSLHYHIVNLQKKSGAMLVTEDEMEKRFADAQKARAVLAALQDDEADGESVIYPKTYEQFYTMTGNSGILTEEEFLLKKSAKTKYKDYNNYLKEMYIKYKE